MATPTVTGGFTETDSFRSGNANSNSVEASPTPGVDEDGNAIEQDVTISTNILIRSAAAANGHYNGCTILWYDGTQTLDASPPGRLVCVQATINYVGTPQDSVGQRGETVANHGLCAALRDTAGNWRMWTIGGTDLDNNRDPQNWIVIDPENLDTEFRSSGSLDISDIDALTVIKRRRIAQAAQAALRYGGFLDPYTFSGGTLGDTFGWPDVVAVCDSQTDSINQQKLNFSSFLSQYQLVGVFNIGDGAASVHMADAQTGVEFPAVFKIGQNNPRHHVSENTYGMVFNVSSDYSVTQESMTFSSTSEYRFDVVGNGNTGQVLDFVNCTILGAGDLNLQAPASLQGCIVGGCGTLVLEDASVSQTTISGCSKATGAVLVSSGTPGITEITFADNSVDIVISASAPTDVSLSGIDFSETPGDVNIVDLRTGAVTITLSDSSAPSVRNDGGGTTSVLQSASLEFTGLVPGTEIHAYVGTDRISAIEIAGTESSGTTFSFTQSQAGLEGYVVFLSLGFKNSEIPITYSSEAVSIPVFQTEERNYVNP